MRRPVSRIAVAGALALSLIFAAPAVAGGHAHHASSSGQAAHNQRFATDAELRGHMQAIRASLDALGHSEHGHLDDAQVRGLAGSIEEHVRAIIATCRLPPDADAALHGVVVPLLDNAATLQADPDNLEAITPMRKALDRYARRFDDPGFAAE